MKEQQNLEMKKVKKSNVHIIISFFYLKETVSFELSSLFDYLIISFQQIIK